MTRALPLFAIVLGACSAPTAANTVYDPVAAAHAACADRSRGVEGNTMTAPYDDCIAARANQSATAFRATICRLSAAGRMINGRCEIDTE